MLGINQTEHNDGDENNHSKIYGVGVSVKREDKTSISIAVLCRDKKYAKFKLHFKYNYPIIPYFTVAITFQWW